MEEPLNGMGEILAWFVLPKVPGADFGACTEGPGLLGGHIFTSSYLEQSVGLTLYFVLSSASIADFSPLSPFVSQSKYFQLGI